MAKLFYINLENGERHYSASLLQLRKIVLNDLVLNEDITITRRIYTEDEKVIERVYLIMLHGRCYLCYEHYNQEGIRLYRSYYPGNYLEVALVIVDFRDKNHDIDWIEIISMRNRQIFGRKTPLMEVPA